MADPFGLSFSPAAQNGPNGQPVNGQRPSPIQSAIQTLSLRIPSVPGASAFTAAPLLTSPGGAALGGNPNSAAVLEQLRRMLFGGGPAPTAIGTPAPGAPQAPMGGGAPDLATIFSQIFGPSAPADSNGPSAPQDQDGPAAPQTPPLSPRFDPGKDNRPAPGRDNTPLPPSPPAYGPIEDIPNDRPQI